MNKTKNKQLAYSVMDAAIFGFDFSQAAGLNLPARDWYDKANRLQQARDAAMVTTPNSAVPIEYLLFVDPLVVDILTAPRKAREIFEETRKGDWTTVATKWREDEMTGRTQAYNDFASNGQADVNSNWQERQQYLFQTTLQYGDLEMAVSAEARIDIASRKQKAAANILDLDANRFYLQGVKGYDIYGFLNDPNVPTATAVSANANSKTKWADKEALDIYNDIMAMYEELTKKSQGLVDNKQPLKLVMSPGMNVQLGRTTEYSVTVLDMLNKYFSSLSIVTLPELSQPTGNGETIYLLAPEVNGVKTGELAFGEKIKAFAPVRGLSWIEQKYMCSTYGCIIHLPMAIVAATGM